jgi:D-alanine-D-alanine ligase
MTRHVAVLMGGLSAEREVSLVSGNACARALESRGYRVTRIDVGDDLVDRLREAGPDCVFNALHGRYGEDGRVQGMLDLMRLPYTHSGVLASALAMDKPMAKRVFESAGLPCTEHAIMTLPEILEAPPFDGPFVVKPPAEGSSVGVLIVDDESMNILRERNDISPNIHLMVEKYIPGRELTCGVLLDEALAVTEIRSAEGFYDYRAKYTEGGSAHLLPADLPADITSRIMDISLQAHRLIGCRGASRADFRFDEDAGDDALVLLEINTQPGMTPLSLLPEQAEFCGISFDELVVRLTEEARCDA